MGYSTQECQIKNVMKLYHDSAFCYTDRGTYAKLRRKEMKAKWNRIG